MRLVPGTGQWTVNGRALVIAPLYFAEGQIAQNDPPPITHPEFFYGFIGITLAWQFVFLAIRAARRGIAR